MDFNINIFSQKNVKSNKRAKAVVYLTSYFPMLLKKHMLTDPIIFEIIISQKQHN